MSDGDGSPGESPAPDARAPDEGSSAEVDRLLVHSRSEQGYRVLRQRGEQIELGELRNLQEGKPITGEMVTLSATDHERVFDVETVHASPAPPRKGPAMVASSTYRAGWDAIFGVEEAEVEPSKIDPKALN